MSPLTPGAPAEEGRQFSRGRSLPERKPRGRKFRSRAGGLHGDRPGGGRCSGPLQPKRSRAPAAPRRPVAGCAP